MQECDISIASQWRYHILAPSHSLATNRWYQYYNIHSENADHTSSFKVNYFPDSRELICPLQNHPWGNQSLQLRCYIDAITWNIHTQHSPTEKRMFHTKPITSHKSVFCEMLWVSCETFFSQSINVAYIYIYKSSVLLVLCYGNPPGTCEFSTQRNSNVESISMSWCFAVGN